MRDVAQHFRERVAQFERECARLRRSSTRRHDIVFLGDSLVEHYRGGLRWVNRGVESDHLRWPACTVFERLGRGRLHPEPRGIALLLGINDVTDAPDEVDQHAETYLHLLTNLRHLYGDARLAVISVLPTTGPSAYLNAPVRALNARLADVAATAGAEFLDAHAQLLAPGRDEGHPLLFRRDGTHLTRRGYRALDDFLERRSAALLRPAPRRRFTRRFVPPAVERLAELLLPSRDGAAALPDVMRQAVARRVVSVWGQECWAHKAPTSSDEAFLEAHVLPEVDFLLRFAAGASPLFATLFLGSRASFYAHNEASWKQVGLRGALERDRGAWLSALRDGGAPTPLVLSVERAFDAFAARLPPGDARRLRLLFIGDCLLEDVELLLAGQALEHGLLVEVDFILSRSPVEQARALAEKRSERWDGVVYSPLSWDFDPEFAGLLQPGFVSGERRREAIESVWERVSSMMGRLSDAFECPVYVHNTAAAVRAATEVRRVVKGLLTWPQRDAARKELGRRIGALVDELNAKSFKHLHLIDELSAVGGLRDDLTLGRFLYNVDAIHPAALSVEVAERLGRLVVASARLASKKVVVCDLDNTLWDGVIGEGHGVRHHRVRQRVLQQLKTRGVVLAVCSKNEASNVRWEGGVLGAGDFVAQEVSWAPKPVGLRKLQATLNLKLKDFVFIDDRADERALVGAEVPGVTVMDPCAEDTWRLFEAWVALLDEGGDRTQLYRERAEREKAVGPEGGDVSPAAAAELFSKLQLSIRIEPAAEADLKRVHELVNRTNQWNLTGARCSFAEVRAWHASATHRIFTARVGDRFGDMGLVCACVASFEGGEAEVLAFVLSCRVFGYGVETLVLRHLAEEARARFGAPRVRGRFVPTAHNKPCADMYRLHGFTPDGDAWVYDGGPALVATPTWFEQR